VLMLIKELCTNWLVVQDLNGVFWEYYLCSLLYRLSASGFIIIRQQHQLLDSTGHQFLSLLDGL
jgi:hypothetical protein